MATYAEVIFYSLLGSMLSMIGGLLLLSRKPIAQALAHFTTPFAAGALLAAVFLDLLPEGLKSSSTQTVMISTLGGFVLFFYAERFLTWFHHHHAQDEHDKDANTSLIVVGDIAHNALDGVTIAVAFLVSVPTGIVTTLAVAAHEIPQEIGDFGLLLGKGLSRRKVLIINLCSALATTVLAVITFAFGSANKLPIGALLGMAAGFLLYIAASDIIPTIHEKASKHKFFELQTTLLLLGIITVGFAVRVAERFTGG